MRTLQQILDVVIDAGYYTPRGWMCNAARSACRAGVISETEKDAVILSIQNYMASVTGEPARARTMRHTLPIAQNTARFESTYEELVHLYRNWANRPRWNRKMWERRSYA